jgi:hypothetical protein
MADIEQDTPATNAPRDGRSRPTLIEPIKWSIWKNRQRRDAIVVELSTFEGRNLISVRLHTTSQDGKMLPTAKGVSLVVARLPQLAKAINLAMKKAKELNLLPDDGAPHEQARTFPRSRRARGAHRGHADRRNGPASCTACP